MATGPVTHISTRFAARAHSRTFAIPSDVAAGDEGGQDRVTQTAVGSVDE